MTLATTIVELLLLAFACYAWRLRSKYRRLEAEYQAWRLGEESGT
jgi:hypothetical protein